MSALTGALAYAWPPFVLVTGLLLIGRAAAADGLFEAVGSRLSSAPGGSLRLFSLMMALVAVVTALLNLDTSVVFLTPVVLHAARRRGVPERPFLYGVAFMSNAASLALPGSNLTNLLVISTQHTSGLRFALAMGPAWCCSVATTAAVVALWCRHDLGHSVANRAGHPPLRPGVGLAGVLAATGCVLALGDPALEVLGIGCAVVAVEAFVLRRIELARTLRAAHLELLGGLFAVAVAAGVVARAWSGPYRLMAAAGRSATAVVGAAAANVTNNLPATVLLASKPPGHPEALLLGLDIGPNLAVFGAMSSLLWLRIARGERAEPSAATFSRVGAVLVPLSLGAALVVSHFVRLASF